MDGPWNSLAYGIFPLVGARTRGMVVDGLVRVYKFCEAGSSFLVIDFERFCLCLKRYEPEAVATGVRGEFYGGVPPSFIRKVFSCGRRGETDGDWGDNRISSSRSDLAFQTGLDDITAG